MANCNKTVDFIAERHKLCNVLDKCELCPLSSFKNGYGVVCDAFVLFYTDEAVKALQKWSDENKKRKEEKINENKS